MALEEDLEALSEEFEDASEAASLLSGILSGLPDVCQRAGEGLLSAATAAGQAGKAASDAGGHFTSASETASAGSSKIVQGMKLAATAIKAVGSAALDLANGPVPSAGEAATALGEGLGNMLTGGAHKATEGLAKLGPTGAAAGAALEAVAAVAAATVGTLLTLAGIAVEVTERLGLMAARFSALAGGEAMGKKTLAMVQQLGQALPFATAKIGEWAMSLERAGIQGRELEAATRAAAASEAIGEGGAAATTNLIKKLAEGGKGAETFLKTLQEGGGRANKMLEGTGVTAAEVAKAIGKTPEQFAKMKLSAVDAAHAIEAALTAKGKDPLAEMMGSWPNLIGKAKEGLFSLFEGLGPVVRPFMAAVQELFAQFNRGGDEMGGLKATVTEVLTPIFDIATSVTKVLGSMFGGVGAGAHEASGGFTKMLGDLAAFLKSADGVKMLRGAFSAIGTTIKVVGVLFAATAAVVAGAIAVIVISVNAVASFIGELVAEVSGMASTISDAFGAIGDAVMGAMGSIGDAITAGLSALDPSAFIEKMKELALSGLAAFKGIFGIKSPSTVMLEHGEENIAGAAATGVDKGSSKMDRAMTKLGPKLPPEGIRTKAAGGGATFIFEGCTFGGSLTQADVDEMMASWWERVAQGGPEPETT